MYNSLDGNPPIGRKVILINNEPGKMMVGTIVDFVPLGSHTYVPSVRNEAGEEFCTLGTVLPYSDRLYEMLQAVPDDGLTWKIFRDISWFRRDLETYEKELLAVSKGPVEAPTPLSPIKFLGSEESCPGKVNTLSLSTPFHLTHSI